MMTALPTDTAYRARPDTRHVASWAARAERHQLRCRLIVVAPTITGLVQDIGGWLFDRVAADWDVTVLVSAPIDTRPLDILGVGIVDRDAVDSPRISGPLPHEVAIAVDLYENDPRIHVGLERLFDGDNAGNTEIRLWGGPLPTKLSHHFRSEQHALSRAALAFKTYALAAASVSPSPEFLTVEHYHRSAPAGGHAC